MKLSKNSPILKNKEELENKSNTPTLIYTPEQQKRHGLFIQMCKDAKEQRDQTYQEFDDMTYEQDYYTNKLAAMTYLRPKINDDEIRIVTGTTEKKLEVLSNEVLSMNLEAEALAYDDADNELKNLGQDMMDIVKRTNDMEKDDDFWQSWLRETITQRASFFEEVDEYRIFNYRNPVKMSPDGYKKDLKSSSKQKIHHKARKVLISGLRVYLGDMQIPARNFQTDQPYIVVYSQRSYTATKQIYGNWSRWEHVKPGTQNDQNAPDYYRMNEVRDNMVEEVRIIDPVNNEYYVILNGVGMMEESTPLWYEVLPNRMYTFNMTTIKENDTDSAYGKSPVASAKTLQALKDEIMRNLVKKFRQAIEPALGISSDSGKNISRDVFQEGAVTQGIDKEDVFLINPDNKGITQAEFNMHNLIDKETERFIGVGSLGEGIESNGEQTATEIQQLQTNAIKNLGHIVAAYMRAKRDAPYLRIYNILENFTSPVKKHLNPGTEVIQDVFNKFTNSNAMFSDGKRGKKIIQFTDRPMERVEKEAVFEFERAEEKAGRPTRFRAINLKMLSHINVFWHIVVTQQRREGSALNRIMFKDELDQAVAIGQITGRQINSNKIVDEFEYRWQVKDFFQEENNQQTNNQQPTDEQNELSKQVARARSLVGSQMTEGARGAKQRPSLTETAKQ